MIIRIENFNFEHHFKNYHCIKVRLPTKDVCSWCNEQFGLDACPWYAPAPVGRIETTGVWTFSASDGTSRKFYFLHYEDLILFRLVWGHLCVV